MMAYQRICRILNSYAPTQLSQYRLISSTNGLLLNQKWRKDKGLPMNPNATGALTDGPDYTFLDGRLTPYTVGQKERIIMQKEVMQDIIKFTSEIDFAVDRHRQMQISEENRKRHILSKKLKPKGLALLKDKK